MLSIMNPQLNDLLTQSEQLSCFTTAVASTDCALTDFYCQCGPNAAKLQASALECLCQSDCTTTDLASTS
jgi:hypothetical protein